MQAFGVRAGVLFCAFECSRNLRRAVGHRDFRGAAIMPPDAGKARA